MEFKEIFEEAYKMMDEPIIDGNCGELCDYHCCRSHEGENNKLGMYLLPLEYELMQKDSVVDFEIHSNLIYEMPSKIKKLYYIFCDEANGCLRSMRPIQCRTYPFEPHIENDKLFLIIEKNQIHSCPLLNKKDSWRWEFVIGIYKGWELLIQIPRLKYYIKKISEKRLKNDNISDKYDLDALTVTFK